MQDCYDQESKNRGFTSENHLLNNKMEILLLDAFTELSPTLASKRLKDNFYRLVSVLPVVPGIIFEHRFHTEDKIDVSLRLSNRDSTLQYFTQQLDRNSKYRAIRTSYEWRKIYLFLTNFSNSFDDCWLEFDDEHLQGKNPTPSILINPRLEQFNNKSDLINLLKNLTNAKLSSNTVNNFLTLIRSFGNRDNKGIKIHYIGVMIARGSSSIRCCLKIPLSKLKEFVKEHQLPITNDNLNRATNRKLLSDTNNVVLSVDIAEQISPRIGIEYSIKDANFASKLYRLLTENFDLNRDSNWEHWQKDCPHLSTLIDTKKILSFPVTFKHKNNLSFVYSRRLNHFKLVFNLHEQVEIKTYLYLALGWY